MISTVRSLSKYSGLHSLLSGLEVWLGNDFDLHLNTLNNIITESIFFEGVV